MWQWIEFTGTLEISTLLYGGTAKTEVHIMQGLAIHTLGRHIMHPFPSYTLFRLHHTLQDLDAYRCRLARYLVSADISNALMTVSCLLHDQLHCSIQWLSQLRQVHHHENTYSSR